MGLISLQFNHKTSQSPWPLTSESRAPSSGLLWKLQKELGHRVGFGGCLRQLPPGALQAIGPTPHTHTHTPGLRNLVSFHERPFAPGSRFLAFIAAYTAWKNANMLLSSWPAS